ncbi:MAG: hypothetical protein OXG25_02850 [Gammaproteobacteria bacterium]|nr:hypothetical protein [Gammaproteobacteria bacterium]
MSSNRRKGFVLGTVVFFLVAVGTYTTIGKLFTFILADVLALEIGSSGYTKFVLGASTVTMVLTIAVPTFATRFILRKFS